MGRQGKIKQKAEILGSYDQRNTTLDDLQLFPPTTKNMNKITPKKHTDLAILLKDVAIKPGILL